MDFKSTSGLESTTSQKNRNFTRQLAEIRAKQTIFAQKSSISNDERAIINSKPRSMLSISLSDNSIDYTRQLAEIRDEQNISAQKSSTSNDERAIIKPKPRPMLSISSSDRNIDYTLQKAETGDKQTISAQDSSTSNNQVARMDSKPRSRLEHSKSNEFQKNIIDILHKKGATEQDISQFKEHTTSLYQQTLDMWKNSRTEEFSRDDRLKLLQTIKQVSESWYQVHKGQATEQDISQFKEHTTSLYQEAMAFSQEMLEEYQLGKITQKHYLKVDKNAIDAFDLWRKANIE